MHEDAAGFCGSHLQGVWLNSAVVDMYELGHVFGLERLIVNA
jgi:hypothetical protein